MHFTQNPIGSDDQLDLQDNAISFDYAMNSPAALWQDRFGKQHKTVQQALKDVGFKPAGFDFVSGGALGIGDRDKCVFYPTDGYWYNWNGKLPYVVPANSSPTPGGKKGWGVITRDERVIAREALRRTYLEVGLNLVVGSFEEGAVITSTTDVVLHEKTGKCYSGPIGNVPKGTDPLSAGFVDKSGNLSVYTFIGTGDPSLDTPALIMAFAIESALIVLNGSFVFNNTHPLSFQKGSSYIGNANISSTDPGKALIHTYQKTEFSLGGTLSFKGGSELIARGYGSKLVVLEECTEFLIKDMVTFGPSCWDGIYFRKCSDFRAVGFISEFNKSSGFTLENCTRYYINPARSSSNGRMSSNGGLPDLVVAMDSHKGRGYTVFCTSEEFSDQGNSVIAFGRYEHNTEYGNRVFAQQSSGNPGVTNLRILHPTVSDSGAPGGTYGPVVTADKGVDIVVNDNVSSPNKNIVIVEPQISRGLAFGNTLSLAGNASLKGGRSFSNSENEHPALFIFSGSPDVDSHETDGFGYYYATGSGNPSVVINNALGRRLKGVVPSLTSGSRVSGKFFSRTSGMLNGLGCDDRTGLDLDIELHGFDSQITINHNTSGVISARTFGSITQGIYGKNNIIDPQKLALRGCSFDKAFPQFLGSIETLAEGDYNVPVVYSNTAPAQGQGVWPDGFFINRRFKVTSGGGSVLQIGWVYRAATDTWSPVGHTII